ncbi:aminopeptidase [candidate division LCP-89 bacterium B3_LCP]|uniref:Aminopeptidase n=1 Tax=candidate division LCP-89 bacterium B3_LCP TaxID=2012998 RepID=A0A532URR1_UNCL8|nr:MAG: aminopeptidase [candidate division LCP-89 bacterium B3_LCP]
MNPQYEKLAKVLIRYSTNLKKGEKVLIEATDAPTEMVQAFVKEALAVKAIPVIEQKNMRLQRELFLGATEERMKFAADCELQRMKKMDAWIGVRGTVNSKEISDVPTKKIQLYEKFWLKPVHLAERVRNTKWVILRVPSPSMAQMAKMSTDAFEEFYFDVCTGVDWKKASRAMDPLVKLMNNTDKVQIKGPGTDLSFSIKKIPAIKCDGHLNMPDLEVFTAPVKKSVNGVLQYNTPSSQRGFTFENVRFVFKNGKIVEATANNTKKLNEILNNDEGARYIGEFAFGLHPIIKHPMDDILFDEKINGSFHFTPGNAYEDEADNGNRSAIHWDLVCIQTPEYGGGEIYFDGKLIRKDGLFIPKNLQGMNPENLVVG